MKKFLIFILMAVVFMAVCFGCGNPDDTSGDTTADTYSRTWKRENYTIVLPNGVTAQEGKNGMVTLFLNEKAFGGIQSLPYENAEELLGMDVMSESSSQKRDQVVQVVAPEGNVASMFTWVEDGEYLVLALSPDVPESDGEETEHYLFPQGDQLYDLFFQPTRIPADKQEILLDSFTLSSQSEKTQEVQ